MRADLVTSGADVYWKTPYSVFFGRVLGWAEQRPEGQRRGRNDRVLVRLADAPELSWLWDREGRWTMSVPVKALRIKPFPAPRLRTMREVRTEALCGSLKSEIESRLSDLRGSHSWIQVTSTDSGRVVRLALSAQDATGLLALLRR